MKRCVIIGSAEISDYPKIRGRLQPEQDFYILCDGGLRHLEPLGIAPDLIIGDFDSHENPHLPVETIVLPHEKDDTDTVFAVKEALRRGFAEFLLAGVIGGRLDHTLGNVSILLMLDAAGARGEIVDDYSTMQLLKREPVLIDDSVAYFSLLNITGTTRGVFIEHAQYPLQNAEIPVTYQYGVSNEVLPGKTAVVRVEEGCALLIKIDTKRPC